jgi:hypothetical protein
MKKRRFYITRYTCDLFCNVELKYRNNLSVKLGYIQNQSLCFLISGILIEIHNLERNTGIRKKMATVHFLVLSHNVWVHGAKTTGPIAPFKFADGWC